ncbi:MAG: hypothetical protein ACC700_12540 [Anaerolineales bacterium]
MSHEKSTSWKKITREERYFTSLLFQDLQKNSAPLIRLLPDEMEIPAGTKAKEVGYEVCFFRDAYHNCLIDRHEQLEKQTFDLVLFLHSNHMVIIEAKAQQGFKMDQIRNLLEAKDKIVKSRFKPDTLVSLVALYSSRYSPRKETLKDFDACITWQQIAEKYPKSKNREDYERADTIYADRRDC